MVASGERNNPQQSVYEVGETLLIRYPSVTKSLSKRHLLEADVVDINTRSSLFQSPTTGKLIEKWISVRDISNKSNHE